MTQHERRQPIYLYAEPMTDIPDWVQQLEMAPHPEGGYFRETWRSELVVGE